MLNWLRKRKDTGSEVKSVTLPELLLTYSRTAPMFQKWDTETAIEEGLKASAIFYACVQRRAQAVAQVPWKAKRRTAQGEWEEAPDSPLQRLLDRPNPDFAFAEMMELASQHIDLSGNVFWSVIRAGNGNTPVELWPLLPQGIKIQAGRQRLIEMYRYQYQGITRDIAGADMVHIKTVNPNDFLWGMPTIQAAGRAVDIDRDSGIWQKSSLENRGVSDYAIVIDPDTTPEQVDRLKKLHRDQQGGKYNARQPMLTTKDIKTLNQSAVEMDFVASRAKVWEEICSAMGVPPPMVGLMENATLANIETARRIFWTDTIIPLLRMMQGQLNNQLAYDFGPEWRVDYDLSDVEALAEDRTSKLNDAEKLFRMGYPRSLINRHLELDIDGTDDLPDSDVGYLPTGLIPADLAWDEPMPAQEPVERSGLTVEELKGLAYGHQPEK